jgi:excisionase family DNA binding protein
VEDVRLETPKQLADRVGVSERQIRHLIATGQLEHVKIGSRLHIPVGAFGRFVKANTRGKAAWRDEIMVQGCDGLAKEVPTTFAGPSTAAAASAALARRTAQKLKSRSLHGSNSGEGGTAQVIRLKSS